MDAPIRFPGYYKVINSIVAYAFDRGADVVTCIGDDMYPPRQGANEHEAVYFDRFPDGFGVMQATGDRQGTPDKVTGRVSSERICGSPTFGREWARRAFMGKGPFGDFGFRSYYCDELLHDVTERDGLLYQDRSFVIDHKHWSFGRTPKQWWHEEANKNWDHDYQLFLSLKARGFPGSEHLK